MQVHPPRLRDVKMVDVKTVEFNRPKNEYTFKLSNGEEFHLSALYIHPMLEMRGEPSTEKQRLQYLLDRLFAIKQMKYMKMEEYIRKLEELAGGEAKARKEIEDADKLWKVKKWEAVAKAFVAEKNILREVRYAVKLLEQEEGKIRFLISKLEAK